MIFAVMVTVFEAGRKWPAVRRANLPARAQERQPIRTCNQRLFEKLCLEGFQSGRSWRTILAKRDNFRRAFLDVDRLLNDEGIVRHRGKIEATINNARCALELIDDCGSLGAYIWRHEPGPRDMAKPQSASISAISAALSKDLKKRGWRFVGPTTVHAFMQAMGLINEYVEGCAIRPAAARARGAFKRPVG
jgi:DNA-3-methyladenine glycosylase I